MRHRAVMVVLATVLAGLAGWTLGVRLSSQTANAQTQAQGASPQETTPNLPPFQLPPVATKQIPQQSGPELENRNPRARSQTKSNLIIPPDGPISNDKIGMQGQQTTAPGTLPGFTGMPATQVGVPAGAQPQGFVMPAGAFQAADPAGANIPGMTTENPTGRQEPCVSLEFVGPPTAKLKQAVSYQIVLKNVCAIEVQQVVVRYKLPNGVSLVGADPKPIQEGPVYTWDIGTLQPRQEKRLDVQLLSVAKGDLACQASVSFMGMSIARLQVREPKLTIKASAPEKALLGDPVTISLTVTNPGDGVADQVKVKAALSDGLEHVRGKTIDFDLGNMAPNETRSVQLVCNTVAPGPQKCDAIATAKDNLTAEDTATIEVIAPRILLAMSGPGLRYLERKATYTLKVTNPGSAPANNVSITDQVPSGFKFVTASDGGHHDFNSRTVTWFVGDLTPGQSKDVQLELLAVNTGEHKQNALAAAARGLKAEAEIMTRVEGLSALLMELVDLDDPIEVGAETSYEIRVTNTGTKTETNLQIVCAVPDKMEFRGARGPGNCRFQVVGKEVIFEPLPKLAPRADAIFRVNVKGLAAGDLRFRAQMKADGLATPVLKEESTKVYGDEAIKH